MELIDLLELAVKQNASDLHLLPHMPPLMRINGDLIIVKDMNALSPAETKNLIYSALTREQQQEYEKNLILETAISYDHIGNFRMSAFHQIHGLASVFRVILERVPTFEELSLPNILKSLLVLSNGLILVTGPTGSGKSTTLAVMIDYINMTRSAQIITIEDPVEYIFKHKKSAINQLQVGRDTPNISTALRAALRQDPDVIMLGELRDLETINLALTAAETGHLVLATLHTGSAPPAISRIIDIFPTEEKNRVKNLLSETLQAVVCQTLVKKLTGGRIAAFEIMLATPAIRHLIRQEKISHMVTTIQTNGHIGMCTLDQYLQELITKGLISTSAARSVAVNQGLFRF
jgi:twitching motility protein PilT